MAWLNTSKSNGSVYTGTAGAPARNEREDENKFPAKYR